MNVAEALRKKAREAKQESLVKHEVMAIKAYRHLKNDLISCAEAGNYSYTTNLFLDDNGNLICFDRDFQEAFKKVMTEKGFHIEWSDGYCVIDWEERLN